MDIGANEGRTVGKNVISSIIVNYLRHGSESPGNVHTDVNMSHVSALTFSYQKFVSFTGHSVFLSRKLFI